VSEPLPVVLLSAPVPHDLRQKMADCELAEFSPEERPAAKFPDEMLARVRGILSTVTTPIDAEMIGALPRLSVISNFGVGYDNVDVAAASARGVIVCNTPAVLDAAVADLALALVLCLARGVVAGDAWVREGRWRSGPAPLTHDLAGKTLGLLGMGRIGQGLARKAKAFDLEVIYHNRRRPPADGDSAAARYVERDELFRQSDFVSVHLPLGAQTRHSIGAAEFALMKPSAYFINTARGALVDEAALVEVLREGRIAGAALDVMEQEPLDPAHPLCALPNVLLQPHAGSATVETRRAMIELAVHNLLDVLCGQRPRAMVNPECWPGVGPGL
jgi:lactate dehydrogenase-like 2-hydroxyacid dehydrogenase